MATSNYERFIATVIKPPLFVYLTTLSVDTSNNHVDATWIVDNHAKLYEYELYSSEDSINWQNIQDANNGVEQVAVPVARFASYIDSTVQPQFGPYFYYVTGFDSCLNPRNSPPGKIISLQGTLSDYYQITLTWNQFELYGATVTRYDLYRDFGTGMNFVRSFDPNTTTYIDSVFQYLSVPGQFCYVIKGIYTLNLPLANYTAIDTTFSNIACVDHRPIIYIPNAFVWNGVNNFFKPKIIFGDPEGYDMTIWDRYGGKIFETHDVNGSWDGTVDGKPVDQGGYPYLIKFTALDGTPVERKGIVIFIKK
jgi:gliding motility-associated-like protein